MDIHPVVLEGEMVRLEPLTMNHWDALCAVGLDESLWTVGLTALRTKDDVLRYIESALEQQRRSTCLPFVTIDKKTGTIAGSTRFGAIDTENRRVEIGWTWLGKHWQRTGLNSEAKFLMLVHAFETWKCIRVEFKTDLLNERSRKAILRIGAKQEGILRNHAVTSTGRIRDTVYFSITDDEWVKVKEHFTTHLLRK
ncbi:MAG: GNAT family N-acetyltransferase [Bacteroidota bacterium]